VVTGGYANINGTTTINGVSSIYRYNGGGIYSATTAMVFANDSLVGNETAYSGGGGSGGGIYANTDTSAYINVVISGNASKNHGGGVYISGGKPAFTNALISGNAAAYYGGGLYFSSGSPTFTNPTIAGNFAGSTGGGVYRSSGAPTIQNAIVAGNSASSGDPNAYGSTYITWNSSLVEGLNAAGIICSSAPLFVNPDTATSSAPTTAGNFRLMPESPAVDMGDNNLIPPGVATDLDGYSRTQGCRIDLGAYEFGKNSLTGLKITTAAIDDKTYDKTNTATLSSVSFENVVNGAAVTLAKGTDYTATGVFNSVNAGVNNRDVTVTVRLNPAIKAQYYLCDTIYTLANQTIAKRPITLASKKQADITYGASLTPQDSIVLGSLAGSDALTG
jgi:hypothetical protein